MNRMDRKLPLINCWLIFALFLILVTPESRANALAKTTAAGGSLTVGMRDEPAGLDPALATDNASLLVTNQIYDTLVRYTPGGSTLLPGLAENWSVSADGLTWTFNLRPGVTFHDGTPLDASAVLFNFNRWWDTTNPDHDGFFESFSMFFGGFRGEPGCLITDMSANGSQQFILQLSLPDYSLPSILANPAFSIASPAAVGLGTLNTNPVGSGPFRFEKWAAGEYIQLTANSSHWGGKPNLTSLTFLIIFSETDRLAAIQSNLIQAALDLPDEYATIVQLDTNLRVFFRPSWTIGYLGMNQAKAPLNEILVRRAIGHAINLPKLLRDHYGSGYQPADQFLPPAIWGNNPSVPEYAYDPGLAKSLLLLAGHPDGFAITLSYRDVIRPYLPNPSATAQAIQADLAFVGIDVTINVMESAIFLDEYQHGNLELFLLGWGADYLHPDNFFTPHFCSSSNLGFGPQDTILCDLVYAGWVDPDFTDQLNLYRSASIRVMDMLPVLPLAYYTPLVVTRSNVAGLVPSPFVMQDWYGKVFYTANWQYLPVIWR